ncbi:hypothetical protein FRC04_006380 [Tulasnella sp. 424]|nr:hypothetical protein FRC04_006380 [Tulasnella sp. 424]KAG8980431.1 hypothetical protein FRC05_006063 [Tulasnella sp. 425]
MSGTVEPSHLWRRADGTVEQRKGLSTGGIIAIVVVVVVVVLIGLAAALLLSRRRRRLAAAKAAALANTGAPVPNAPGPNYLPPMPELERPPAGSAPTQQPQPQRPAASGTVTPIPAPSAAKTSKVQRPPSPIRFPAAPQMPQPSFGGGFIISGDRGAQATASPYPVQPVMREPGWR